ncbi:unnamed protein product [Phaedon cochleariae]|uniref:DNA polymerase theta n=1 Tax=Phaedon cochleariae TaxID=80249 RepID=A0A9N9SL21_PHACE|nr:unnamed protein product [Phaedon cochleariae]
MHEYFMNDTFDDLTLEGTHMPIKSCREASFLHPPGENHPSKNSHSKPITNPRKSDVSFDDSFFLSESSFSLGEIETYDNSTSKSNCCEENQHKCLNNLKTAVPEVKEPCSSNRPIQGHSNVLPSVLNIGTGGKQVNGVEGNIEEDQLNQKEALGIKTTTIDKCSNSENSKTIKSAVVEIKQLSSWGLPQSVLDKYETHKLKSMFQWQVDCLSMKDVLSKSKNLVYSAPTSAGKTLVAEILAMKTIFETKKKVIFILPFVSIVREKMYYFQDILSSSGIRVEGFMGSYNPPGGFSSVQVAICTIEKANSLINRLLEEEHLGDIGAILVDEMHLLGDPHRGYLLELLLTKLKYISKKDDNIKIQVVGMSATLPNLSQLAKWLDAELYTTNFRPIPLHEQVQLTGEVFDKNLKLVRKLNPLPDLEVDTDNVLQLCLETIGESCSILIFCPTKNWCENLAQQISAAFHKIGSCDSRWGKLLRSQLNTSSIRELLEQLKYCPVGLDDVLRKTVSFAVAFHHAGLTLDERDIIEAAFRNGALRVLVATSTLSSGVNLPARRVIIRTPNFHGKPMDTLTYRQMIGRAGRMGKDSVGESILICQNSRDLRIAKELMNVDLRPVESCLEGPGKLKRAILEVIASGVASSPHDIDLFASCTLLSIEDRDDQIMDDPIKEAVKFLNDFEFIRLQKCEDGTETFIATSLGKACLSSSMAPDEGLALFTELEKARRCFVLDSELHLVYLVTPYSACQSWGNIDWMFYLDLWEKLPGHMKKVGELVGVKESYIVNATRGKLQTNTNKSYNQLLVHKRFFVALALQDLVNEKPLNWVCAKFSCNRGMLQSLQQSSSSFAGMVTSFSRQLGWSNVELLISQFQDRMQFGVSRDLLDLMQLPIVNGKIARALFNAGIETLVLLANSDISTIELILYRVAPFETVKGKEGESEFDQKQRNKYKNVWITGKEGLTEREAAEMLVGEARSYLKLEMGLAEAKWASNVDENQEKPTGAEIETKEIDPSEQETLEKTVSSIANLSKITTDSIPKEDNKVESVDVGFNPNSSLSSSNMNISYMSSQHSGEDSIEIEDVEDVPEETENLQKTLKINLHDVSQNTNTDCNMLKVSSPVKIHLTTSNATKGEMEGPDEVSLGNVDEKITKLNNNAGHQFLSPIPLQLKSNNINVLVQGTHSDQSLFDESFDLHLSGSEGDTSSRKVESVSFLEEAFSESFDTQDRSSTPSDIHISPFCDVDANKINKRKNNNIELETPTKKLKTSNENIIDEDDINNSYILNKLKDQPMTDFNKMEIVNVCQDKHLFEIFCSEIRGQTSFSLSLASKRIISTKQTIGNIVSEAIEEFQVNFTEEERKLTGVSFAWGENFVYYISLDNPDYYQKFVEEMKLILKNTSTRIRMFDAKEQIKALKYCCDLDFLSKIDDPKIADWILDPEGKEKTLKAMALKYCPEAAELSQLCVGCKGVGSVGLDLHSHVEAKTRSAVEAMITWHLMDTLKDLLKEEDPGYLNIYETEADTVLCLANMELSGMSVSKTSLQELVGNIKHQITAIETQAYSLAGKRFNFQSSKEVAKILGMLKGRKVASTRKQVLLKNEHPISDLVMQWRKLSTTLTKTIYPLIRITKEAKIHGCYITHTATGRITMHEPNLQNIAKDFNVTNPLTNKCVNISCRSAFLVPAGFCLLSADYCQLELRLLTHLSRDRMLCDIMNRPGDVFKSIAAQWNHVEEEKVDDSMRQRVKHICYGIIYGMGSRTLADQLNIDENEASQFITTFKDTYPGLKTFIKDTVEKCRINSYVQTITGRKRFLPNINDANAVKKGQAERQAVNTVVQGSAADIAKKAMVKIDNAMQECFVNTKSKPEPVLHLHDEIIYQVPVKYLRKSAIIVKENMENVMKLSIPLPVKIRTGESWGSMSEMRI